MRIAVITCLLIGLCFSSYGQKMIDPMPQISLDGNIVEDGDIIDIYSFTDLQIEVKSNENTILEQLELQFVIVPFNATVLVFKAKSTTIRTIDIDQHLAQVPITPAEISHVQLNVLHNEVQQNSITIFTRKLETGADYFREFVSYAGSGNAEMAIWNLDQALLLDPKNIEFRNARAQFYWETGKKEKAFQLFNEILKNEPNYLTYSYLGEIYSSQQEFEKAIDHYSKALNYTKNDDELSLSYQMLGAIELMQYNYQAAYDHYQNSLKHNPKNIAALNNIASLCDEVGTPEEKVGYFQRIIDADPSFYLVHVNIGFHYLGEEKFEEALAEFDAVLAIDSTEALTLNNKSFALLKLNRLDEAMEYVNKSLKYGQKNAYAYRNRALIQLELGKDRLACFDLSRALELKFTEQYGNEVIELIEANCR